MAELCAICKKTKDGKGLKQLTTSKENCKLICDGSATLNDGILHDFSDEERTQFKYHQSCFRGYKLKIQRAERKRQADIPKDENSVEAKQTRRKKQKSISSPVGLDEKPCVICNHVKHKGVTRRVRLCENERIKVFIQAKNFYKDDVYTRCIFVENYDQATAADLVYHSNCMSAYILKFQWDVRELLENKVDRSDDFNLQLKKFVDSFREQAVPCSLTDCRNEFNSVLKKAGLEDETVDNRSLKNLLIDRLGMDISFTYPKERNKSQIIFPTSIKSNMEARAFVDPVVLCAEKIRGECKSYDFQIDGSYKDSNDCKLSMNYFENNRPVAWDTFCRTLFKGYKKSTQRETGCDLIFQILYSMFFQGYKKTPMQILIAQMIHDISKSKIALTIFNQLYLSVSYTSVERIDTALTKRLISLAGQNRVPVSPMIVPGVIIHGVMDNWDHQEHTYKKSEGSHDMVFILVQNRTVSRKYPEDAISVCSSEHNTGSRCLKTILPCQQLLTPGCISGRGTIGSDYVPSSKFINPIKLDSLELDYKTWITLRYLLKDSLIANTPSYSAVNSVKSKMISEMSVICNTPILPHPATEIETVYTTLKNFQDVLMQEDIPYGPLWSDEGVYRIAKELQLLFPTEFKNIFLGLGGFHLEKVVIACCGKYLENSGMKNVMTENEIYGTETVNSVFEGTNYVMGSRGMALISECSYQLLLDQMTCLDDKDYLRDDMVEFNKLIKDEATHSEVLESWSLIEQLTETFFCKFQVTRDECILKSQQFHYWNKFLTEIYPPLRDLKRSFREGSWDLHVSSIRRIIPLVFAFDRINYKRWLPIYFEDCLALKENFPLIFEDFSTGGFVVKMSKRRGSAVPMDQALEKAFNKPSKGPSGIIGISRRKEAVAKWTLIKQEKMAYTSALVNLSGHNEISEYSLHHEFSENLSEYDNSCVKQMKSYILTRGNPFNPDDVSIKNIVTGAQFDEETCQFLLECTARGETRYDEFKKDRLVDKTKQLFDTIPKTRAVKKLKNKTEAVPDVKKETIHFLRVIDQARVRGYPLEYLLCYEITPTSFFLTQGNFMRKPIKSEMGSALKGMVKKLKPIDINKESQSYVVVVDFMAFVRKVPVKKMGLLTFGNFASALWKMFTKHCGDKCSRIDIVFDNYFQNSIKEHERIRRSKGDSIITKIFTIEQSLPVDQPAFWSSSENKIEFQRMFIKWIKEHKNDERLIYLGGVHSDDPKSCKSVFQGEIKNEPSLWCEAEEADDRMMAHVNHAVLQGFQNVVIASQDTDVLITALYNHNVFWNEVFLWILYGSNSNPDVLSINELSNKLDPSIIRILPAAHALTGCDTTSKVSTKKNVIKTILTGKHNASIEHFGKNELDEDMIKAAELFLVRCFTESGDINSFDELRYSSYHKNSSNLDLEKLHCTSAAIILHIRKGYFQCRRWLNSADVRFNDSITNDYGYDIDGTDDNNVSITPVITTPAMILPADFPIPCTCGKCARDISCPCRARQIMCCKYCKCNVDCKNPYN